MGLEGSRLICWGDQVGSTDAGGSRLSRRFMFVEEVGVPMTELGESPHWCSITESLFYVDITANLVCQYSPSSKVFQSMKMDSAVGFAIPTEQTKRSQITLLVGLEDRIVEVNFTTKNVIRTVATLPDNLTTDCRFNDGKCNHHGRLYAGYMNKKWREGIYGNVYRLVKSKKEPGSIDPMRLEAMFEENEIILPNGLIWRKDGYVFYIDSGKNVINSYKETSQEKPAEKSTSVVGSKSSSYLKKISTVYKLNDDDILSGYLLDGMTLDCNGKIWVRISLHLILYQYCTLYCILNDIYLLSYIIIPPPHTHTHTHTHTYLHHISYYILYYISHSTSIVALLLSPYVVKCIILCFVSFGHLNASRISKNRK